MDTKKASVVSSWEECGTFIKTLLDVAREPILILDKDLRVLASNEPFYRTFQVEAKDTEGKVVYELGNGQWNIPALRRLLEDILPKNSFFKGFEVAHEFPVIGRKVMILNARHMQSMIYVAIEDVTEIMMIAEKLAGHADLLENKMIERTHTLEAHVAHMERELQEIKNKGN